MLYPHLRALISNPFSRIVFVAFAIANAGCSHTHPGHQSPSKRQMEDIGRLLRDYFGISGGYDILEIYGVPYDNFAWAYRERVNRESEYAYVTLFDRSVFPDWRHAIVEGGFPHHIFFHIDLNTMRVIKASTQIMLDKKNMKD